MYKISAFFSNKVWILLPFLYRFKYNFFYEKTALVIAAENDNTEIVKLLLSHQGIDINAKSIFIVEFLISFQHFVL